MIRPDPGSRDWSDLGPCDQVKSRSYDTPGREKGKVRESEEKINKNL